MITAHHFAVDGRSAGIILRELATLYSAECLGVAAELPIAASFSEYIGRVVHHNHGTDVDRYEDYWRHVFSEAPEPLELPANRPRSQVPTYSGARCSMRYSAPIGTRSTRTPHGRCI